MLKEITVQDLRIIQEQHLVFVPGVNLVCGSNGSGKTTLLEAVYLIPWGRTFRHRESQPLVRNGENVFRVVGKIQKDSRSHIIGIEKGRREATVRFDGKSRFKRSEILQTLPVQWIGPDPQSLLTGEPEQRRRFIDGGLFHVEHHYLSLSQQYSRALEQRNSALRNNDTQFGVWDKQLVEAGERITQHRKAYLTALSAQVEQLLMGWGCDFDYHLNYSQGWKKDNSLEESLKAAQTTDRERRFTSVGPHRADVIVNTEKQRSGKQLSRGQLKLLVLALVFAQSQMTKKATGFSDVLLLDDLAAELDRNNRALILQSITEVFEQSIITALAEEDLVSDQFKADKVFHVEHGVFSVG